MNRAHPPDSCLGLTSRVLRERDEYRLLSAQLGERLMETSDACCN